MSQTPEHLRSIGTLFVYSLIDTVNSINNLSNLTTSDPSRKKILFESLESVIQLFNVSWGRNLQVLKDFLPLHVNSSEILGILDTKLSPLEVWDLNTGQSKPRTEIIGYFYELKIGHVDNEGRHDDRPFLVIKEFPDISYYIPTNAVVTLSLVE